MIKMEKSKLNRTMFQCSKSEFVSFFVFGEFYDDFSEVENNMNL